jgi:diguanylate cyclase (GGDEF)-like protein/PAS domain S-box-containing protein
MVQASDMLQAVVQAIGDGLVVIDPTFRVVWQNGVLDQIYGEVVGQQCYHAYQHRDSVCPGCATKLAMETRKVAHSTQLGIDKDGGDCWVELVSTPLLDDAGQLIGAVEVHHDITERERIAGIARQRERLVSTVIDSLPAYAFVKDASGRYLLANQRLCDAWGLTKEEIAGKTDFDVFPRELAVQFLADDARVTEGRQLVVISEEATFQGNQHVALETRKAPLVDEHGQVVGLIGLAFDIGQRKIMEESLREALQESRRRGEEVSSLLDSSRAILEYQEFDQAIRSILDSCRRLLGAQLACVVVFDDKGRQKEVLCLHPETHEITRSRSLPDGVIVLAAASGLAGEVQYWNELSPDQWAVELKGDEVGLENILFAPLVIKGKTVGLLGLGNRRGGFDRSHVEAAAAFAELVALALRNGQMLESLENSEARFRAVAQSASDAIICLDSKQRVVFWNLAAESLFGYSTEDMTGQPVTPILPRGMDIQHQRQVEQLAGTAMGGHVAKTVEVSGVRRDGREFPAELSYTTWTTREGMFYTSIVRDITERQKMLAELRALSLVDELTGLYNRRGFSTLAVQQLKIADRSGREIFLLFLDLDDMKWINDTLGHHEGDLALIATANTLRASFRESDIVARIGGDEFAVVVTDATAPSVDNLVARLRERLEDVNAREGHRFRLSVSLGAARYDPERPCSVDELLEKADKLMYEEKRHKQKR